LLYDARADIPQVLREELLEYYINEAKKTAEVDAARFRHYFWYFAMIRILQAMGAYGFLGIAKGKKRFLESIPFALKNINFILNNRVDKSEFSYLKNILSEIKYEPA
jgi:aminoglycoside/choline kinase family phosphotransferase